MQELLDIHGQHETQSLLKQKYHLQLLDYADNQYSDLLNQYQLSYNQYKINVRIRGIRIRGPGFITTIRLNEISIRGTNRSFTERRRSGPT